MFYFLKPKLAVIFPDITLRTSLDTFSNLLGDTPGLSKVIKCTYTQALPSTSVDSKHLRHVIFSEIYIFSKPKHVYSLLEKVAHYLDLNSR